MRTAAQFAGGADIDDAHLIAVLLPEEHHGPEFLSLSDGHHTMQAVDVFQNLGVDEVLHTVNFLVGQRLVVHKVETRLVGIDLRPFLLHMIAEHFAQRLVHQVRRRVIAHGAFAGNHVNLGDQLVTNLQTAGLQHTLVPENRCLDLLRVFNRENTLRRLQHAAIADLSAGFGVKRRFV